MNIELTANQKAFIDGQIEALYFTDSGEYFDESAELSNEAKQILAIDALAFLNQVGAFLDYLDADYNQAGIDFWLSRNGHGSGFFDEVEIYGVYTDKFQSKAESFGEVSPYQHMDYIEIN